MTVETASASNARSSAAVLSMLTLVALAQASVLGYASGRQAAWLIWSALALIMAAIIALHHLTRAGHLRRHAMVLAGAASVAVWLGAVQVTALSPEYGFRNTWMWWSALLLVPVARLAWLWSYGRSLLLVLVVPAGLHGLWLAGVSLVNPMPHRYVE